MARSRVFAAVLRGICVWVLVLVGASLPAAAEPLTARAVVDRDVIDPSETVELSVIIGGESAEVDLSPLKDFQILSRGTSTSVQIVNFSMTRETRNTYLLAPLREGTLTIPVLAVTAGSTKVMTEPIVITVQAAGQGQVPGQGGGPSSPGASDLREGAATDRSARDAFLTASVSDRRPWLGEPLDYTIRFARRVQIADAHLANPSFDGFSFDEKPEERNFVTSIDGVEYQVTELRYRLIPLRPGALTIDAAGLTVKVPAPQRSRPGRSRNPFFDDPFFSMGRTEWRMRTFRSDPVKVDVRQLPPVPAGLGTFSGLLGSFTLDAGLSPREVSAGESATLSLTVKGSGNVGEAPVPEFKIPDSLRSYPDQPDPTTPGEKTFRFALVPSAEGTLDLGPFRLNFFDPEAGKYRTAEAPALSLAVEAAAAPGPAVADRGTELRASRETGPDITGRHQGATDVLADNATLLRYGALLAVSLFILWRLAPFLKRRFLTRDRTKARLAKAAGDALRKARGAAGTDAAAWADAVYEAVLLAARLKSGSAVPPSPEELEALFAAGPEADKGAIAGLLHAIEGARFGAKTAAGLDREELTRRAERIVEEAMRSR